MKWPDLSDALGPIRWAVVGAVATRRYMPERATNDLDAVIAVSDGPAARQQLREAGFEYEGELAIGGSAWRAPDGSHVDLLERDDSWLASALKAAGRNRDPQGLPVLPLPYLALMKMRSGRVQDLADVARMLGLAPPEDLARVRATFKRHAHEDLEDLESLIQLGRLEMQPPQG